MARVSYRELKRQAKSAHIHVKSTKYSPFDSSNVHADHKDMFAVVQSLGRTSYENYGHCPTNETPNKPWQLENKMRALKLVYLAVKCRKENRNEAGWRNEVESKLFERFDIEVACKRCRKRLWASEIESNPALSNSKTTSLEDRQRKRGLLDPGMSDLFSSRLEEPVCQAGANDAQNPKKEPDRIHGLQRTSNFERLLQQSYAHETNSRASPRSVEDVVKVSVNPDNGGDPLLFPFLVLEAKGEKAGENFEQMEIQTAFPIRNILKLQYDLLKTPGNTMDVPGGPLVWFFASRGEDWRVYAASVHEENGLPNYWINYLWGGSVTGRDEALQLILIVDYILDWARDIYRPNLLRQLKMLGLVDLSDGATVAVDPDVYSTDGRFQDWMRDQEIDPEEILDPNMSDTASIMMIEDAPTDPLGHLKTPLGIVRDAKHIESRIRALYLTRDNFQMFLLGFENPDTAMKCCRNILIALNRRCVVLKNEEVLNAVENSWTGNKRPMDDVRDPTTRVYAQFRISYYVDHGWNQIRELKYLAVADDARELLIDAAKYVRMVRGSKFNPPECSRPEILRTLDGYLQRNVEQDFTAALSRHTFLLDMVRMPVVTIGEDGAAHDDLSWRMVTSHDQDNKSPGITMQNVVDPIYAKAKYRSGQREPSEPYLRVSSRQDYESRSLAPETQDDRLNKALVYGAIQNAPHLPRGSDQKLCLYILDGQTEDIAPFSVVSILLAHLHRGRICGTLRKGKVYQTSRKGDDNRTAHEFKLNEVQKHLNVGHEILKSSVYEWIKLLTPSEVIPEGEGVASALEDITNTNVAQA
ncbi:uncharacterized protein PAC_11136 [Phialocephala subalpina]|uniref:Uncharacterized protein n=1 Tax=Phialocephala subalpina TaxID=576137 RepID=A0A1L7X891_9HELO|nr:uncharacterized protein PAC_11136 [Phialocephala subalpina]